MYFNDAIFDINSRVILLHFRGSGRNFILRRTKDKWKDEPPVLFKRLFLQSFNSPNSLAFFSTLDSCRADCFQRFSEFWIISWIKYYPFLELRAIYVVYSFNCFDCYRNDKDKRLSERKNGSKRAVLFMPYSKDVSQRLKRANCNNELSSAASSKRFILTRNF